MLGQVRTRSKPRHFPLERVVDEFLFFGREVQQHRHGFYQLHRLNTAHHSAYRVKCSRRPPNSLTTGKCTDSCVSRWTVIVGFMRLLSNTIQSFQGRFLIEFTANSRLDLSRVTTIQRDKYSRLFQMKLQVICQTNAHLLIQILCEHNVWKMNYSTHKVQASYFVELQQSNFPDDTNFQTFPWLWANPPDISRFPEKVVTANILHHKSSRSFCSYSSIHIS